MWKVVPVEYYTVKERDHFKFGAEASSYFCSIYSGLPGCGVHALRINLPLTYRLDISIVMVRVYEFEAFKYAYVFIIHNNNGYILLRRNVFT